MRRRITEALKMVGLAGREDVDPSALSGGQKQRLAIAGALAMQPQALILDESTSMLDPVGAAEVLQLLRDLHQQGLTIIMITHDMSEVLQADKVAVMSDGKLMLTATPREVFARSSDLQRSHIELPLITQLGDMLDVPGCLNMQDLLDGLKG
jgi:energy-coupling factor transport system ATP-binding protein